MTLTTKLCPRIGPAVLCFLLAGFCQAQSFVFASPDTRTHMPDAVALASQDSFEQQNFLAVARYLAARLCPAPRVQTKEQAKAQPKVQARVEPRVEPRVQATIGMDGPGAENSAMVTGCKSEPATYLGELLGRYAHQKWILVFNAARNGTERLFVITLPGVDPEQTLEQMRKRGLNEGTVIAREKNVVIYVWVKDKSLDDKIHALAESSNAAIRDGAIQEIAGAGVLIGNDDRAQAQRIFDRRIFLYERAHNVAFSVQLWSKKLHDLGLTGLSPPETPLSPLKTNPAGHGAPSVRPSAP